jgi:hypothetical protein
VRRPEPFVPPKSLKEEKNRTDKVYWTA